jgi:hypothetical protein
VVIANVGRTQCSDRIKDQWGFAEFMVFQPRTQIHVNIIVDGWCETVTAKSKYGVHLTALSDTDYHNNQILLGREHGQIRIMGGGVELEATLLENLDRELSEEGYSASFGTLLDVDWIVIVKQGNAFRLQRINHNMMNLKASDFYVELGWQGIISVIGVLHSSFGEEYRRLAHQSERPKWYPNSECVMMSDVANHHVQNIEILGKWNILRRPEVFEGRFSIRKFYQDESRLKRSSV